MKLLVTGGLGTLGAPLVTELRRRGHQVWVADKGEHKHPQYLGFDVSDHSQVEALLAKGPFDLVYHLAAQFGRRRGEDFYRNLWLINAVGTKNLLRMQERLKFRMVFASSSEIYGDYRGVMSEDVPEKLALRQLNDYALSKWVNEVQILNSAASFGTETVRVRLFNNYGPGEYYSEYRSVVCLFVYNALHNLPYTVYTKHRRVLTYVDDTVNTLANIADRFHPGEVYNIANDKLHGIKEISDTILRHLGKDDSLVEYRDLAEATVLEKRVAVAKAVQYLGHQNTVSLEEGIARTIAWQKGVYGIA